MGVKIQPIVADGQQLILGDAVRNLQPMVARTDQEKARFAQRLSEALTDAGYPEDRWRLTKVSQLFGVSREAVRKWLAGETLPDTKRIPLLAAELQVSGEWLLTGQGQKRPGSGPTTNVRDTPPHYYANVREPEPSPRSLVVLNYVQAGRPREVIDDYAPGAGMDHVPIDAELAAELGPYAFVLIVSGYSMWPDFKPGERIVVDPDVRPNPGDYVIGKLDTENEVTFKKYRPRGRDNTGMEIFELVPLNDDYPTIIVNKDHPGHIVGTVVEHIRKFRMHRGAHR